MSKIASLALHRQAAQADTDLREADETPVTCAGGHRTTSPSPFTRSRHHSSVSCLRQGAGRKQNSSSCSGVEKAISTSLLWHFHLLEQKLYFSYSYLYCEPLTTTPLTFTTFGYYQNGIAINEIA